MSHTQCRSICNHSPGMSIDSECRTLHIDRHQNHQFLLDSLIIARYRYASSFTSGLATVGHKHVATVSLTRHVSTVHDIFKYSSFSGKHSNQLSTHFDIFKFSSVAGKHSNQLSIWFNLYRYSVVLAMYPNQLSTFLDISKYITFHKSSRCGWNTVHPYIITWLTYQTFFSIRAAAHIVVYVPYHMTSATKEATTVAIHTSPMVVFGDHPPAVYVPCHLT
jgi:hypothetical protein